MTSSRSFCEDDVKTNLTIFREGYIRTQTHSGKTVLGTQRPAGSLLQTRQHPLCTCGRVLGAGKRGAVFQPCSEWGWRPLLAVALAVRGLELDPAAVGGRVSAAPCMSWLSLASTVTSGSTFCPLLPYTL